ncbi:DUF5381 family protein [Priestia flexa]|uniref:DUF5381 family protein n=1 Tax=Priestia flexa TaxID=86664 RepID=UPI00142FD2D7
MYVNNLKPLLDVIFYCLIGVFNNSYEVRGDFVFIPTFTYLSAWFLPGLIPGKTLISLVKGPNGYVKSKKGNIPFRNIKEADLRRNGFTLVKRLVINMHDGKQYCICTYDLIDELDINVMINQYVYPYMTPDARKVWNEQVNFEKLHELIKYKREDNMNM